MIKAYFRTFGLIAAALLLLSPAARAEGKQDFTLINKTGVEIHNVYVSPHSSNDWEEDVLGRSTLADGESVLITFSPKERAEWWDLKVTDKDGNGLVWDKLNLLEISEVTLFYDHDKGKGTADLK